MAVRKYDKDDVLKYVYGELPPGEEADFVEAMCADQELFAWYEEIRNLHRDLEEAKEEIHEELEPSEFVVLQVLNYARNTSTASALSKGPSSSAKRFRFQLAGMAMVATTALFVTFTVFIYQSSLVKKQTILNSSLQWDVTDLDQRIQMARLNAGNIHGDREVIMPVYSNTYRLIRTDDFAPVIQNVVLLSIE
jgi:anti-sigma-K factor RskA